MGKPKLIIINGLPASGKSTLATKLGENLAIPVFAKDDFKEIIADTIGYTDHESTRNFGRASFSALFFVAQRLLEKRISVITEGNFSLGKETEEFLEQVAELDVEVYEILCHADSKLLVERFESRMSDPRRHPVHHTLGEIELHEWYARTFVGSGKTAPLTTGKLLEIDTSNPEQINYGVITEFLA